MTTEEQIVDSWRIHNRINLYLLEAIAPDSLGATAASKGRSVGEQFAHIHNVRLMYLEVSAKELMKDLAKVEKTAAGDRDLLRSSLEASGAAMATFIEQGLASGKIKGFKPHPAAFVGYLIAHEAHHRGQLMVALKEAKAAVDKKIAYGMWEWGVR